MPKNLPRPHTRLSHDPNSGRTFQRTCERSWHHLNPDPPYHRSKLSTLAAALAIAPKRALCGVGAWLAALPAEDQTAAAEAFLNPEWQSSKLLDIFKSQGFPGQITTVTFHRRGRCSCP